MQKRTRGDATCYCTVIWLFCCKNLCVSGVPGVKRLQKGNLPELVLFLCHEHLSIGTVSLSSQETGGPVLSLVPGFPGCSVGKHLSEHLGSHLLNRVAVYWCVLRGSWENKHCQLWSAQVLRARCLLKINGRGKKKQAGKESSDLQFL